MEVDKMGCQGSVEFLGREDTFQYNICPVSYFVDVMS